MKWAAMLSEIHFRSLRTKMLLQSWTDEIAKQLEVPNFTIIFSLFSLKI